MLHISFLQASIGLTIVAMYLCYRILDRLPREAMVLLLLAAVTGSATLIERVIDRDYTQYFQILPRSYDDVTQAQDYDTAALMLIQMQYGGEGDGMANIAYRDIRDRGLLTTQTKVVIGKLRTRMGFSAFLVIFSAILSFLAVLFLTFKRVRLSTWVVATLLVVNCVNMVIAGMQPSLRYLPQHDSYVTEYAFEPFWLFPDPQMDPLVVRLRRPLRNSPSFPHWEVNNAQ